VFTRADLRLPNLRADNLGAPADRNGQRTSLHVLGWRGEWDQAAPPGDASGGDGRQGDTSDGDGRQGDEPQEEQPGQ
jgi:hypothetical protein